MEPQPPPVRRSERLQAREAENPDEQDAASELQPQSPAHASDVGNAAPPEAEHMSHANADRAADDVTKISLADLEAVVQRVIARERLSENRAESIPVTAESAQLAPLPTRIRLQSPEKFTGVRSDLDRFERAVDRFVRAADLDASVMTLIPTLLAGEAENWYNSLERMGNLADTWAGFRYQLRDRFGDPAAVKKARDKLDSLTFNGSVAKLRRDYEAVLLKIPTMSIDDQIEKFVKKLPQGNLRFQVEMQYPSTLEQAFRLAEKVELADAAAHGKSVPEDEPQQHGRGRRGRGRGREQEATSSAAPADQRGKKQTPRFGGGYGYGPRQNMGLAVMEELPPVGAQAGVLAGAEFPAHTGQALNAMQRGQPARPQRSPMSQENYERCMREYRCFHCKVAFPDRFSAHEARDCPAKKRGEPEAPMPPPVMQSQDARQVGNGSGRRQQ
jgi:hypothetical protein